ncbi:MAG TPA: caspase family protein [Pseudonocardiaceae bacterium]|nr:caspase family protein [Pseudonocardiaceae bacterium]
MPGTALLIGAELDGLSGVANDIDAMAKALASRGLTVRRCVGEQATRAGILAAYERLIDTTESGNAAVVYYSGHGGFVAPPGAGVPGPGLMDMQFIAPVDYHDSQPDDFRGITSVELSVLLARLTRKTGNATVVLDCCHAAHMSRDPNLRVRALSRLAPYDRLRAHVDRLRRDGLLRTDLLVPTGNPNAVRIVACAPEQSAFEYQGHDGQHIGILTESLTMALAEVGTEQVSWATIMDRVRRRVLALSPFQRPELEGPARRLLFDVVEDDPLSTLRVTAIPGDRVRLECASLLGVRRGDAFAVMPPGTTELLAGAKVGDLLVDLVEPLAAEGTVTFHNGWTHVPLGARAHRVTAVAPAIPVAIAEGDPRFADLARAVSMSPMLRLAGPDEPWRAEVRIGESGDLTLADRIGPVAAPRSGDAEGTALVVRDLNTLARASALRELAGDITGALGASITLDWGRVQDARRRPLPTSGGVVRVTDRIYVSVRNDAEDTVFVSLIDIGVTGRITVLTRLSPSGVKLVQGKEYVFGFDDFDGVLSGVALTWPDGLDTVLARPETVLVLITAAPQDVSVLEQDGVHRDATASVSPLQRMLDQIATGRVRDLAGESTSTVRYDVHAIDFELEPPGDEGRFLIDERPNPPGSMLTARELAPATVAVRVEDLVVHRNRAVFGADIRVDAIVLTGIGDETQPTYRTKTERFSHIRDGEPLPLDRMLVYHGLAVAYLDIALWVSRDMSGSRDLGDLMAEELTNVEMQDGLARMGAVVMSAPYAAATAAAVGVSAVIVNVAYKLLRGAAHNVIGLYRGSMLAHERFGAGRHPASGTRRVQDFSLAYSIERVD